MTLADELQMRPPTNRLIGRPVYLEEPPCRLAFDGKLSEDEQRMLEQCTFEDFDQ